MPENLITLNTENQEKKVLRVTIDIREDMIKHWGGIVINNFSMHDDHGETLIVPQNVTVPGFVYKIDEKEPTFLVKAERISQKNEKRPARKPVTGRKSSRKKSQ